MSEATKVYIPRKLGGNTKHEKDTNNQLYKEKFFEFKSEENLMVENDSFSSEFSIDLFFDESVEKTILLVEPMKDIDIPI